MLVRTLALLVPLTLAAAAAAAPASAPGKSKPARGPTALHTTHVRAGYAADARAQKAVASAKEQGGTAKHPGATAKADANPPAGRDAKVAKTVPAKPDSNAAKTASATSDEKVAKTVAATHETRVAKTASTKPDASNAKKPEAGKLAAHAPCLRFPVWVTRGTEEEFFPLTTCDGSDAPGAVEHLSVLARSDSAQKPSVATGDLLARKGDVLAPGIKRLDERLPHALQVVLDHFDAPGPTRKVHLVSGYRPASSGSYHATGHAIDFRIDGVRNEALVAFCKTLGDVGCGYYPNSTFVHLDVRPEGTGHVSWIDASGPGESPRYVSVWPPPPEPALPSTTPVPGLDPLPEDEHPAAVESSLDVTADASTDMPADASPDAPAGAAK